MAALAVLQLQTHAHGERLPDALSGSAAPCIDQACCCIPFGDETLIFVLRRRRSFVEDLGYPVVSAESGIDCLQQLHEMMRKDPGNPEPPVDLILLDVLMPQMDGERKRTRQSLSSCVPLSGTHLTLSPQSCAALL